MKPAIAFVGVGRMGANMTRCLKSQDYPVTAIYDRNTPAAQEVASEPMMSLPALSAVERVFRAQ